MAAVPRKRRRSWFIASTFAALMLLRLSSLDDGEVDIYVGDLVQVTSQGVEAGVQDHLDDLPIVIAGGSQRTDIVVADDASRPDQLGGKAPGHFGLRIVGGAAAVGRNLGVIEPCAAPGAIGVQRQAVWASVFLGDGERDTRRRLGAKHAVVERSEQAQISPQRGGADGEQPNHVGHAAEPFCGGSKHLAGGERCLIDRWGWKPRHGSSPWRGDTWSIPSISRTD